MDKVRKEGSYFPENDRVLIVVSLLLESQGRVIPSGYSRESVLCSIHYGLLLEYSQAAIRDLQTEALTEATRRHMRQARPSFQPRFQSCGSIE